MEVIRRPIARVRQAAERTWKDVQNPPKGPFEALKGGFQRLVPHCMVSNGPNMPSLALAESGDHVLADLENRLDGDRLSPIRSAASGLRHGNHPERDPTGAPGTQKSCGGTRGTTGRQHIIDQDHVLSLERACPSIPAERVAS